MFITKKPFTLLLIGYYLLSSDYYGLNIEWIPLIEHTVVSNFIGHVTLMGEWLNEHGYNSIIHSCAFDGYSWSLQMPFMIYSTLLLTNKVIIEELSIKLILWESLVLDMKECVWVWKGNSKTPILSISLDSIDATD